MRSAVRALTLALLAGAMAAPSPASSSSATPVARVDAGPVLAGDAVVWGRSVSQGYEIVWRRGTDTRVSRVIVSGLDGAYRSSVGAVGLAASDRRLLLGLNASTCASRRACDAGEYTTVYSAVLTGPPDGRTLEPLTGCLGASECAAKPGCVAAADDVSGDVVAFTGCDRVLHVRDLAPGASPAGRDYADRVAARVAGSYLAANPVGRPTTVTNWRTGYDLYSIRTERDFDVQADGKLAFRWAHDGIEDIAWASPSEPFAHNVTDNVITDGPVRIAADRIAYRYQSSGYPGPYIPGAIVVTSLGGSDGSGGRMEGRLDSMDLDGSRLTWVTAACGLAYLMVQDLAGPPASGGLPDGECPLPAVVRGSARIDRRRRVRLELACPVRPGFACLAHMYLIAYTRDARDVSLRPGQRSAVRLRTGGTLCRQSPHRARVRIVLERANRFGEDAHAPVLRLDSVRVRGKISRLPPCHLHP